MSQALKLLTSCDATGCLTLSTQEFKVLVGDRLPETATVDRTYVMLPDGWQQVGVHTFCPRHKISVQVSVDGVALPS